tara:strand:+ start:130 stop:504 length:375 start_codon:yes stop_codon:yes gene_type:complete
MLPNEPWSNGVLIIYLPFNTYPYISVAVITYSITSFLESDEPSYLLALLLGLCEFVPVVVGPSFIDAIQFINNNKIKYKIIIDYRQYKNYQKKLNQSSKKKIRTFKSIKYNKNVPLVFTTYTNI